MPPSTTFDIPIGSTTPATTPLGMLARTSPPVKPAPNPTKLASKMVRATSTRRSALDRAVSFARSHLTSVHESVRRKSMQDAEQRKALAAKLRAKLLACETRRSAELARRASARGVKRNNSSSSVSSKSSTASSESVALDELQDVVARFAALDLVQHDECSRTLDELVVQIEDAHTMDVTRELLNEIALVAAMYPRASSSAGWRRTPGRKRSHESLKSDRSSSSAPSSPASEEGVLMDGDVPELLESNPFDTRTFLAAMATSLFPSQVLRAEHPMDDMLFEKTTHMIDTFARLISHPTLRRVHAFVSSWTHYATQFAEWKLASQQTLIHELIAHYLEVDRMWQEARPRFTDAPPSAPVLTAAVEYVQGLRNRQVMILNRLDRFGGKEARKALARSRGAECEFDLVRNDMYVLLGPNLGALIKKSKQNSVLKATDSALELVDEETLVKSEEAQHLMRDVQAAHDLYLDGVGDGNEQIASAEEKQVEATLKRAFRVQKQAMFRRDEMHPWLVECLQLLCQNIANSTSNPSDTTTALTHICDLEWISARVSQSTYTSSDLTLVLSHLTTYMRTLCSPARDPLLAPAAPASTANPDDVIVYLFHLLDVSQLMLTDLSRARRVAVLPDLSKVIIALERKHFASQSTLVALTKQWLTSAMDSCMAPATRGSVYRQILDTAVIHLLLTPPDQFPETFHLDTARLAHLSELTHRLLLAATLVTHAKQHLPTAIGSGPLVALVHANHVGDAVDLVLATVRAATSRKSLVESLVNQVTGLGMSRVVGKCVGKSDPVYKVLARRVEADLRAALMNKGDELPSVCKALDVVGERMAQVLGKVVRMARLNRVVHAEVYDRVLDEVVGEMEAARQMQREE